MNRAVGLKEADVVVAGGGPGGIVAAIAAARNGADTILIEQLGFPGGMFTGGNMAVANSWPYAGIAKEIFDRLKAMGAAVSHPDEPPNYPIFHFRAGGWHTVPYDPEMAKIVLFEMAEEAGVKLLLHTYVTGAITEGNSVRGVTVENKSGTTSVIGKVVCDATGDGDVVASAGAEYVVGMPGGKTLFAVTQLVRLSHVDWPRVTAYSREDPGWDNAISKATNAGELPFYTPRTRDMVPYWGHPRPELAHLWWEDGALLWGGTVGDIDGTNADDLTRGEVESRRQWMVEWAFLKKYIPGFENSRVEDSGVTVGVRQTRHIVGEYTYTGYDILEERKFPDEVAYITPEFLGVPYRCFVPKTVDGVLIAARCMSTTPGQTSSGPSLGSYNNMKSIPTVMSYGQASGTAAALAAKQGVRPRDLDINTLQSALRAQNALLSQEQLDAAMSTWKPPSGLSYKETMQRTHAELRDYWGTKGYKFTMEPMPAR